VVFSDAEILLESSGVAGRDSPPIRRINYHSPKTRQEELARVGIELLAPYSSSKRREPNPKRSAFLSRFRYRIDTVFSQLTERYSIKRVWARDVWHLVSRLLCAKSSHTLSFLLNHRMGNPPLQLEPSSSTKTCTSG
jgi:hypothetical protein